MEVVIKDIILLSFYTYAVIGMTTKMLQFGLILLHKKSNPMYVWVYS